MYNYIPHPSNYGKSSMVTTLLIEEGHAAYGIYWMILELLRDAPDYRMGDSPKNLAWAIHANDVDLVDRVLHNYGLFDKDNNGLLYSPWLIDQMAAYDDKKRRLQEAGRRGAARRAEMMKDREALATLPLEDREAKATLYNITQPNITQPNITQASGASDEVWRSVLANPGPRVDDALVLSMGQTAAPGFCPGYVAQVCRDYGIGRNVMRYIIELTGGAALDNDRYKAFVSVVKRMQADKFTPKLPGNYILSKIA